MSLRAQAPGTVRQGRCAKQSPFKRLTPNRKVLSFNGTLLLQQRCDYTALERQSAQREEICK